jgi:hypothetical protein
MKANRRQAQNSRAFRRVLKEYLSRKMKTTVSIINPAVETKISPNKAVPTDSDFFADCELAWDAAMFDNHLFIKSVHFFLFEEEHYKLTDGEQRDVEQKVGREFLKRRLYPTEKYFERDKNEKAR